MELVLITGAGIGGPTPRGRVFTGRYPRARGGAWTDLARCTPTICRNSAPAGGWPVGP